MNPMALAVDAVPAGRRRRRPYACMAASMLLSSVVLTQLSPIHGMWIDPDTAEEDYVIYSLEDGREYELVMSEEFNVEGRTFEAGADPRWTAQLHSDDSMTSSGLGSLQYYNDSYVSTNDGFLNISTVSVLSKWKGYNPYKKKYEELKKYFNSGMLESWNKFCFTGGIIEMSAILPGEHDVSGLWPAFWLLGNLGRATYEASTNLLWPWSYDKCNRKLQRAQEISACNGVKHWDLKAHQGRGSTEIDILEALAGVTPPTPEGQTPINDPVGLPYISTTLQLAPGLESHRPTNGELLNPNRAVWYEGMRYGPNSTQNYHFYGLNVDKTSAMEPVSRSADQAYVADAISAITKLGPTHFQDTHRYRLEWQPGVGGYLRWYLDDVTLLAIDSDSLDLSGAQIPEEPSYIILNTAVSSSWGFPIPCPKGCTCECFDCSKAECRCAMPPGFCNTLPASFMVDWVRVWQHKNDTKQTLGCDPDSHPTRLFIQAHKERYMHGSEKEPVKKIKHGGGKCHSDNDCYKGTCSYKKCSCEADWVGPTCKVPNYHDEGIDRNEVDLSPLAFQQNLPLSFMAAAIAIAVVIASVVVSRERVKRKNQYYLEIKEDPANVAPSINSRR